MAQGVSDEGGGNQMLRGNLKKKEKREKIGYRYQSERDPKGEK